MVKIKLPKPKSSAKAKPKDKPESKSYLSYDEEVKSCWKNRRALSEVYATDDECQSVLIGEA